MPVSLTDAEPEKAPRSAYRVDAHLHLWTYSADNYGWIDEKMAALRQDFLPGDLIAPMQAAGVQYGIAVQARQDLLESRGLLAAAACHAHIAGVVGWLPLSDQALLSSALDEFSQEPKFVGVRHIVQSEPEGFLDGAEFNSGVARLRQHHLVYDLLLHCHQMEEAIRFVDRHPSQPFVLDHLAKPQIRNSVLEPWSRSLRELGRRSNVACKVSGMVTEADWHGWKEDDLRPYLDTVTEAFGPERLLAGSDWPICLLATTYTGWWGLLGRYFASFSAAEQALIFGENATRIYQLSLPHRT